MICGSSTVATRRRRPAQRGQARTSTPNAGCIHCAQAQWRGRARGAARPRPAPLGRPAVSPAYLPKSQSGNHSAIWGKTMMINRAMHWITMN